MTSSSSSPSLKDLGNQFYVKGDYEKAIELYKQGIEELGSNENGGNNELLSILKCNISTSYIQLKKYEESLKSALEAIESNPNSAKAFLRAGESYIGLKLYKEAKENYLMCIKNINTNDESSKTLLASAENGLLNSKMKQFYQPILESSPELYNRVEIKYLDNVKEKALFAKETIQKGEIVFSDLPYCHQLSVDSLHNHFTKICSHCIKFINTSETTIIKCGGKGCNYQYCSEKCKQDSIPYHSQSCLNLSDKKSLENNPIYKYRKMVENAPTSTQLLLAESIISMISYLLKTKKVKNCNLALGSVTHLKRTSLMAQQPSFNGKNLGDLQKQYQPLLSLLEEQYGLKLKEDLENNILSQEFKKCILEFYDNLLGMINFNSTSTVIKSGNKVNIVENVQVKSGKKTITKSKTRVQEDQCWGVGLFPIFSCMNHSCLPNIEISNEIQDGVDRVKMVVKAKKLIPAGSEILHSYCDENLPTKERKQLLLSQYGFKCLCPKCSR
ncbi:hypothetical protein DICPUDRAFT_77304 [Dictyostelium purpureum]|uniref:SET domain-containing protein n=1 Tax=Dictyostelium purpureum TaxID=5786 RepID=F0ZG80_DICPU|nr:uncharacterized protein DICPUDRAFT_77304 [Dictyostelium purpureum]EGC37058.1 hypothetical protein DICPUDRAFT_77304 [Dictyostelium purpureum]|eukprot:XP_003286415.1 hypothetical protein DICPUDRAFT_77304 [Dictyostelium purpureum]